MPELNHKFTLGRMNKDADERLVQNGEYRDALNAQVTTSDGSDIGTLQNLLGSTDISHDFINFDPNGTQLGDFEYECIGSIVDGKTDRIYWMLSGAGKDIIAEYDYTTQVVLPVIVDIYNINVVAGPGSGRVLNFDKNFLITGINIVDDFLFWTDNNTEPKQVNIQTAKMGCVNPKTLLPDFTYQTDLYVKTRKPENQVPPFVNVAKMKEEHITVIKKSPKIAPRLQMKNTLRGDADLDGFVGNIQTTITFNTSTVQGSDPVATLQDNDSEWLTGKIAFQTDSLVDYETGDFLTLTLLGGGGAYTSDQELSEIVIEITSHIEYNNNYIYLTSDYDGQSNLLDPTKLFIGGVNVPATNIWFEAEIVSGNLTVNSTTNLFNVSLKQEDSIFKFKFPRFATRYKYTDGQYSTFSPFSEVAFLPSKFDYLPKEGYNLGMVNSVRKLAIKDFVNKQQIPEDVVEMDILYKESNSPIVYAVDTIKRVDFNASKYDSWNAININDTSTQNTTGFVRISSEVIHSMIPSNQLLRVYDNVPRKALAQEIVGNRIVYGNYLQNYNMENSSSFAVPALISLGVTSFSRNSNITIDAHLTHTTRGLATSGLAMVPQLLNPLHAKSYSPAKSIKTLRTYQVGVSYIDEFGRETPVFSSSKNSKNSLQVPKSIADQAGSLKAQMFSMHPEWAKNFKFLIKESSNEYYNLAMDRWYPAQDGNIWLSFPSAERNKVDDETFLILKKRHNSNIFVPDNTKYKILAIENEAPLFIKTKKVPKKTVFDAESIPAVPASPGPAAAAVRLIGTAAPGFNDETTGFPATDGTQIKFYTDDILSLARVIEDEGIINWEFRVRHAVGGTSNWYKIQSFEKDPVGTYTTIVSKKQFGLDMGVTSAIPWGNLTAAGAAFDNIQVEFVRNEVKDLPEFDGRFFVKVLADSTIKKAIVGQYAGEDSTAWQVTDAIRSQYINPETDYDNTGIVDQWDNGSVDKWFGSDKNTISIEDMGPSIQGNKMNHAVHDYVTSTPPTNGQTYWDKAGKTNASGNASSGWFIDKIEAFRPWKITGGMGWDYDMGNPVTNPNTNGVSNTTRNDNSYFTNQDTDYAQATYFGIAAGVNGKGWKQQLKLVGTNTHSSAANTYLNQADLKPHGTMLRDGDTNTYGGVIPSLGIDKISNGGGDIIHLSYSGVGSDEPLVNLSSLSQLKTRLDDAAWATSFVDDVSFITAITQQGALWRWAEDPDGIIYRTSGYDPSAMSGTLTQQEWNNNTTDKNDGGLGVGLYNYTSFCDYIVPHLVHYVQEWLFFPPSKIDSKERSHFVSVGRRDTDKSSLLITGILGVDITIPGLAAGAGMDINNSGATSAGGWGGTGNAHYEYPSFTKEWGKARNRRRRYMFAAKPYIDGNGKIIDSSVNLSTLGNVTNNPDPSGVLPTQTGNYLPTNDPGLTSHFLDDGTALPRDPALALQAGIPVRPSTDAPGIRPDGVYSGFNGTVPAIKTTDAAGVESEAPGSCTFELVVPFIETDDGDEFTTTNPAIWETEPKKDLDLDLYYEVGQTYPTDLNSTTMEQFVGPIRDYDVLFPKKNFNTKVTCFEPSSMFYSKAQVMLTSGAVYDLTSATAAGDPGLAGSAIPGSDDIRVVSHSIPASNAYCTDGVSLDEATCLAPNLWYDGEDGSDHHVWLEDVNGVPLIGDDASLIVYPGQIVPAQGSFLRFTREDGSTTESKVMSQAQITGPTLDPITGAQLGAVLHNAYELDSNSHNYEVSLPWHNCYSFGNGVESNRVRDDYNQVFIDKGAKVSTVLEEPYLEDRRSSGLIYSGIYNSMSNVNNLNQFIQAEKITKDLNPDGGSIQKLYTRDTNLVTICEDKVFKILASKDALFNADGNPQLVATNKVLGEATTFAGDYGISTNPESFAVDSFRMYFTDRVRGAVIRLSQDGITPISSIGMTDWFNDNLVSAKRLIGSFDDKKKEYNLNLAYFDYATYSVDILCDAKTILDPLTGQVISQVFTLVPPGVLVLNGTDASKFSIGDIVDGEGIKPSSVITAIDYQGGGAWWIKLNQTPDLADLWALLPQGQTLPFVYGTYFTFPTRITASKETQPSNTISFSEKNKGWVSFKSFLKEGGLSLNNEYFTFKHGMLNQHHTNPVHNNFYGEQFDSSVEVLFNEIPGSVKSFGALNYEGSQSHITQDLNNSAEYWDNKDKLGWYVSEMHTNLQEVDLQEFKDKEGKWFSQIKGVTTKWLDDGMGGNIDTNEFSYQGIDDNSGVTIIDGGYTSWDCMPQPDGDYSCTEIPGLSGSYATEQLCLSDPTTACGALCTYPTSVDAIVVNATDVDCALGSVHVNFPVLDSSASFWNVSYTALNVPTRVAGSIENDLVTYYFFGDSNSYVLDAGKWRATTIDSNGCKATKDFEILCNYNPPVSCVNNFNSVINVVDATQLLPTNPNICVSNPDGSLDVTVTSISTGATTWSVEYFSLINGILTSIYVDNNFGSGYQINSSSFLGNLVDGDYVVLISDSAGCDANYNVHVNCSIIPPIVCGSGSYDLTNPVNANPTSPNCNNGSISWDLAINPNYSSSGAPPPITVIVTFHESTTPNIPITTTSYAANQLPLTISNTGLSAGVTYGYTISDNNGCTLGQSWSAFRCQSLILGCTDQWATNYDPAAVIDDGSCFGPCSGTNWPTGFTFLGQPFGNTQSYFETALYANGVDNDVPGTGVNLGKFRTKYACGVTHLSLNDKGICDLTGLEAFWDLETIDLGNNGGLTNNDACELREIPTSTFPKLRVLGGDRNHLSQSGINLSANHLLEELDLSFNAPGGNGTPSGHIPLTTLDLTNNPLLKKLYFRQSTITDVDLSTNNGNLTKLTCQQLSPGAIINLGINVDLTTLSFSCGLSSNMTVKVGTVARANQGNALMLTGGSAPFGGIGHWSVTGASVTFVQ